MDSLGKIAQKDPQTVIRRWSRRHNDNVVTYGQHFSTTFILSEPLIFRRVCLELVTILAFGIGQSAVRQQLNCWEGFLSLVERRLKLYEHASTVVLGVSTILMAALWAGGHVQNARYFAVTVLISGSLICSGNVILIVKDIFIEHPPSAQRCLPLCIISPVVLLHTLALIFFTVSITVMAWQGDNEGAKISCLVFDILLVLICLVVHFSFQRATIHNLRPAV